MSKPPQLIDSKSVNYCDCGTRAIYRIGNARICAGCWQKDHSDSRRDKSKKTGDGRGLPVYLVNLPKASRDEV